MSAALQYAPRYNVNDYQLWKGDWELWDGIAIAMTPSPFGRHQAVAYSIAAELRLAIQQAGCDATALGELDWIVRHDTVVRPDVIVICGRVPEQHLQAAPALIAEVLSPSTRHNDLTYKRQLYAEQRVGTYLIVDPDAKSVQHLTLTDAGDYREVDGDTKGRFTVCGDCELELDLSTTLAT